MGKLIHGLQIFFVSFVFQSLFLGEPYHSAYIIFEEFDCEAIIIRVNQFDIKWYVYPLFSRINTHYFIMGNLEILVGLWEKRKDYLVADLEVCVILDHLCHIDLP